MGKYKNNVYLFNPVGTVKILTITYPVNSLPRKMSPFCKEQQYDKAVVIATLELRRKYELVCRDREKKGDTLHFQSAVGSCQFLHLHIPLFLSRFYVLGQST